MSKLKERNKKKDLEWKQKGYENKNKRKKKKENKLLRKL